MYIAIYVYTINMYIRFSPICLAISNVAACECVQTPRNIRKYAHRARPVVDSVLCSLFVILFACCCSGDRSEHVVSKVIRRSEGSGVKDWGF